jgi:hypothetical protein
MALRDSWTFMWQHDWNEQGGQACLARRSTLFLETVATLVEYNIKSHDPN